MGGSCVAATEAILQMLQKRYQLGLKTFWKNTLMNISNLYQTTILDEPFNKFLAFWSIP